MDPAFCTKVDVNGVGMHGSYKKGYKDFESYNDPFRIPRIWPTHLGKFLDIETVVNISKPARSNDTIYDTTISWILENYIIPGKDTSDLLVVIGWSSPERKNIIIRDTDIDEDTVSWLTLWPNMEMIKFYSSSVIKKFFKFYVAHQWVEQEYLKRFIEQNYQLQNFCKVHNIDYYFFNAFYSQPGLEPDSWKDVKIPDQLKKWEKLNNGWGDEFYTWDTITKSLKQQWDQIDSHRFVNKDKNNSSFRAFIQPIPKEKRLCNWHPSPTSHEVWARYLSKYIKL
jgi:hypothetical protein